MERVLGGAAPSSADGVKGAGERDYYSISQAAILLGVSRVSIWRWIGDGRLPAARLGHRTARIRRDDLERLLLDIRPAGSRSRGGRNGSAAAAGEGSPVAGWAAMGATEHFAQFYEADGVLLDAVSGYIGAGLRAGDVGVVIATEAHRDGLEERLRAGGLDVAALRAGGRYVALDAAETLSEFMLDGTPDPGRFAVVVGSTVARAAEGGRRVRAFGEMVALLAVEGNTAAAIRLEALWNGLQNTHQFSLFCAYPMRQLAGEAYAGLVTGVCAEHSRVLPAESYSGLADPDERFRTVAVLQQKAQSLEAALAAERAARAEAEAAVRARDEFLSIASHELRTPLAGLKIQVQLALRRFKRQGPLSPELAEQMLETIGLQADKLSRLLGHLLDTSRLQTGRLTLERRPTDLTALAEQVVADARAWSDRHTVTLDAPGALRAEVDPLRLEQVMVNLLDNAIKYSPDGGEIEVVLAQAGLAAELSVRDRGMGIPRERRGQLFERFYQAHGAGYRSGLGLGLYVSRQIVEVHGGAIRAEFPADGGTRFVVSLPLNGAD